jgi:hypothetical protein
MLSPREPPGYHRATVDTLRISSKAESFTESAIREVTRLAAVHDVTNLGQGYPDFPPPDEVKRPRGRDRRGPEPVPDHVGAKEFRDAIAEAYAPLVPARARRSSGACPRGLTKTFTATLYPA